MYHFSISTSNFLFNQLHVITDYAKPSRKFWETNRLLAFSLFCHIPLFVIYLHVYRVIAMMIWLPAPSFNLLNKQMSAGINH